MELCYHELFCQFIMGIEVELNEGHINRGREVMMDFEAF